MLNQIITPPRAWTAESAGDRHDWTIDLPADLVADYAEGEADELDAYVNQIERWRSVFQPALDELNCGKGFVLLNRLPVESLTPAAARRVYWRIGQSLGDPIEQNIEGALLYDVKDFGEDVGKGARFSVTNAESSFHTDAPFAVSPPEFVGLLSLRSAMSGGESQLVSAYALHNALSEEMSEGLALLYRSFSFDRRGQFHPGEPELLVEPVFRWDGLELDTRYLHYYITQGHESSEPLTTSQTEALNQVISIVSRPEMRVEFSLRPGEMLFTNNHWILHNRTAFEDHHDPDLRRHYIRLWLRRKGN